MKTITFGELQSELERITAAAINEMVPPGFKTVTEWAEEESKSIQATRCALKAFVKHGLMECRQLRRVIGGKPRRVQFYGPSAARSAATRKASRSVTAAK